MGAQMVAQMPQQDPLAAAQQAVWKARTEGRFEDAAASREEARGLLDRLPVNAPQYPGWVQGVAQIYQSSGRNVQARAIVQQALDRTTSLGESNPVRIQLLTTMANYWQQERNLLKSVAYMEKAVAALEAAPPEPPAAPVGQLGGQRTVAMRGVTFSGLISPSGFRMGRFGPSTDLSNLYQQLADLDRQLGRVEAAAAVVAKLRALATKNGDASMAGFLEQQGQLDEAAALYQKLVERAQNPQEAVNSLQTLANLYSRQQRYDDAVGALQQAIASQQAAGTPEMRSQVMGTRQHLAGILQQAGRIQQADAVYQDLLAGSADEQRFQALLSYANYLVSTKRAAQGEVLLKEYQASNPNLQPWQENNLLNTLANSARSSGDLKRAEEYQAAAAAANARQSRTAEPAGQVLIGNYLQKAQAAANAGNVDEAFSLALQAIDAAPRAADREQIGWVVTSVAGTLAARKGDDKALLLYQRLFSMVESWSADSLQPLLTVTENYTRFLIGQRAHWAEVPAAIERYRTLLITAHGAESGSLGDALHMTIDFERNRHAPPMSLTPAEDLLALEESLSGTTSEPYLRALRDLAQVQDYNGDRQRSLPLRLQMVAIADRVVNANNPQRGEVRMEAARALAVQGQFDEAERLAAEAVAIGQSMKGQGPWNEQFKRSLEQIRQMRAGQQKGEAPQTIVVRNPDGSMASGRVK